MAALFLVEIMCAVFFPDVAVTTDILGRRIANRTLPQFQTVSYNNNLFWILTPNQTGREKLLNDFAYTWFINSLGLRDDEVSKKQAGVTRILILGDSQTFGIGVEHVETFCAILEEKLNVAGNMSVDVINAGTHAYGTAEEFFRLQQLAPVVQPDIIITALHADNILIRDSGNDLWNNKEWLEKKDPAQASKSVSASPLSLKQKLFSSVKGFFCTHSHLMLFLYRQSQAARGNRHCDLAQGSFELPPQERGLEDIWETTRKLLVQIDDYSCIHCNARHIILYIPGPLSLMFSDNSVEAQVKLLGIDYVSAYEELRTAKEASGKKITFEHDGHYNAVGHEIIANVLLQNILQNAHLESKSHPL